MPGHRSGGGAAKITLLSLSSRIDALLERFDRSGSMPVFRENITPTACGTRQLGKIEGAWHDPTIPPLLGTARCSLVTHEKTSLLAIPGRVPTLQPIPDPQPRRASDGIATGSMRAFESRLVSTRFWGAL